MRTVNQHLYNLAAAAMVASADPPTAMSPPDPAGESRGASGCQENAMPLTMDKIDNAKWTDLRDGWTELTAADGSVLSSVQAENGIGIFILGWRRATLPAEIGYVTGQELARAWLRLNALGFTVSPRTSTVDELVKAQGFRRGDAETRGRDRMLDGEWRPAPSNRRA